jgi:uncharacterized glyoxalase superfamily protein PhnB
MIRQIAPVFFTLDIPRTLAYYGDKLGFACLGTWQDPPVYAIVTRDEHAIHFRCAEPPVANPDKYEDELLDAYVFVEDADALYAEYAAKGVEFVRELGNMPWQSREFVVKDCDGLLGRTFEQAVATSPELCGASEKCGVPRLRLRLHLG